ncbi:hypothetical protein D3C83_19290 [compost metagenome]
MEFVHEPDDLARRAARPQRLREGIERLDVTQFVVVALVRRDFVAVGAQQPDLGVDDRVFPAGKLVAVVHDEHPRRGHCLGPGVSCGEVAAVGFPPASAASTLNLDASFITPDQSASG